MVSLAQAAGGVAATAILAATVAELSQPQRSTHWSFYVLVGAACVGAIVAIAGAVLANYPLTAASALLCLTNILGAFFLKRFSFYRDFDQTVDKLEAQTKSVTEQTKALETANGELTKQLAPLLSIEEALKAQLSKRQEQLKAQAQTTGDLTTAVDQINHGAAALLPAQIQAGEALSYELQRLIDERDSLEKQVTELQHSATIVKGVDDGLDIDRADFHQQIETLKEQIKELEKALEEAISKETQVGAETDAATKVAQAADTATTSLDLATEGDAAVIQGAHYKLEEASEVVQDANQALGALNQLATFMRKVDPDTERRATASFRSPSRSKRGLQDFSSPLVLATLLPPGSSPSTSPPLTLASGAARALSRTAILVRHPKEGIQGGVSTVPLPSRVALPPHASASAALEQGQL